MKRIVLLSILLILGITGLKAQPSLKTTNIATNLDTPWEILWGPDNYIWFTERQGKVSRVNPESGEVFEVITIEEVREVGEGGLLGMVIDPDFKENNFFYVAYNYFAPGNDYREKIVRLTFNPASGKADSPFVLIDNIDGANNHNGCRLIITPDKKLIFSTGDAANTSTSQNISNINGKMLRINLDGTIPDDNPIPGSPVWTWGHRNPQGLVFSPDSSILYSSEHGTSNDDEINIITKGRNYGWPKVQGFCDNATETTFCRDSNVVEPIYAWTPTLAVAGIDFYNFDLIPEWKNSLLVTSLKASRITQLSLNNAGTSVIKSTDFFTNEFGRLRDICISPDGKVYVATSNRDGRGSPKANDDKIIEIAPETTSITEKVEGNLVTIFPNPARDVITISFSKSIDNDMSYSLYNVSGQLLKSGILNPVSTKILLPENFAGIAFLSLSLENQTVVKKIIINK